MKAKEEGISWIPLGLEAHEEPVHVDRMELGSLKVTVSVFTNDERWVRCRIDGLVDARCTMRECLSVSFLNQEYYPVKGSICQRRGISGCPSPMPDPTRGQGTQNGLSVESMRAVEEVDAVLYRAALDQAVEAVGGWAAVGVRSDTTGPGGTDVGTEGQEGPEAVGEDGGAVDG